MSVWCVQSIHVGGYSLRGGIKTLDRAVYMVMFCSNHREVSITVYWPVVCHRAQCNRAVATISRKHVIKHFRVAKKKRYVQWQLSGSCCNTRACCSWQIC